MSILPRSEITDVRLLDLCEIARQAQPGAFLELGVYKGGSACRLYEIAQAQGRQLLLFDTFEGIPEQTPNLDVLRVGMFSDTSVEAIVALMPKAIIHRGVFPASFERIPVVPRIAFAHIDCDQYQTCREAVIRIWPNMVRGGIMAFDDYPTFKGIVDGVREGLEVVTPYEIPMIKYTTHQFAYIVKS